MAAADAKDDDAQAEHEAHVLGHGWDGDAAIARRLIEQHPEMASRSLFAAAACGNLAEVERRIAESPADADRPGSPMKWTPLAYVAYSRLDAQNAIAIARALLDAGADPNFQFDDGWGNPFKILTGAIRLGEGARPSHPQADALVDLLVEAGADPFDLQAFYNISLVGEDTHWYEVLWRHCETHGGVDRWRNPAAGRPGGSHAVSTIDYLLGNAVAQNHVARAAWLLERGADPAAPHAYSGQALHGMARVSGFGDMAALLLRHGAPPAQLEGAQAFQAECLAVNAVEARRLLAADPSLITSPAPLLMACETRNAPAVELLLSLGASPMALGEHGISPLHKAAQSGSLEVVKLLLAAGADVDLREQCWQGTPLSWAVVLDHPHIAEHLAPIGRDVRALANMGQADRLEAVLRDDPSLAHQALKEDLAPTPIFCLPADPRAAVDVARVFLSFGADPRRRNSAGKTAIDSARECGLDDAAALMEAAPPHATSHSSSS